MHRAVLFVFIGLMACDWLDTNLSRATSIAIPELSILKSDPRITLTTDGTLLLDSTAFSGYLVEYYSDSMPKSKKGYYQGKLEGVAVTYYPEGQLFSERPYTGGKKHGEHLGYYKSGQLKFHYYFEQGLSQGTHRSWYKNGDPYKEMNYKDGYEFGLQKVWRPDGKLRSNYVIRENGRRYGMLGLKRCSKIDSETGDIDPYEGVNERQSQKGTN